MKTQFSIFLFCVAMTATTGIAAPPKADDAKRVNVYSLKIYSLDGLPVWIKSGLQFDPTCLVKLIEEKIDSAAWGSGSAIKWYEPKESLLIMTTNSNHNEIAKLLASVRAGDSRRQ